MEGITYISCQDYPKNSVSKDVGLLLGRFLTLISHKIMLHDYCANATCSTHLHWVFYEAKTLCFYVY